MEHPWLRRYLPSQKIRERLERMIDARGALARAHIIFPYTARECLDDIRERVRIRVIPNDLNVVQYKTVAERIAVEQCDKQRKHSESRGVFVCCDEIPHTSYVVTAQ